MRVVRGDLAKPAMLEATVRRMLADPRSERFVANFADQWLQLRNLKNARPNSAIFPDFDDNLRNDYRQETEMLFASVLNEDRSVLDLLRADYTFLNERLAKQYGVAGVYGSNFRRVSVDPGGTQRPAGPGQHPHRYLPCRPHFARGSRQVDSGESAWRAAACAAARRAAADG